MVGLWQEKALALLFILYGETKESFEGPESKYSVKHYDTKKTTGSNCVFLGKPEEMYLRGKKGTQTVPVGKWKCTCFSPLLVYPILKNKRNLKNHCLYIIMYTGCISNLCDKIA